MKKPIISRTIISNVAHILVFDMDKKAISDSVVILPAAVNTVDRAEKYIRKHESLVNGQKLVSVDSVEKVENLVGMYLDTFVANADKVEERSKDTRECVTKLVTALEAVALYMDKDRKVQESIVTIPMGTPNIDTYVSKNIQFNGKFITVASTKEVSQLYAMSEAKFISLAKPMRNKFTLDD